MVMKSRKFFSEIATLGVRGRLIDVLSLFCVERETLVLERESVLLSNVKAIRFGLLIFILFFVLTW